MNKKYLTFLVISIGTLPAMESLEESLLKYSLLEFVKISHLPAIKHLLDSGQWHLISSEIKEVAKSKYVATKQKDPAHYFDSAEAQIYYTIQMEIFLNRRPQKNNGSSSHSSKGVIL